MNQLIIKSSLQLLSALVFLYSIFMFLRGHNDPGGGFIGGLILSLSLILQLMADPSGPLKTFMRKIFLPLISLSVLGLILVGFGPLLIGKSFLQGVWTKIPLPIAGKLSSILIFDLFIFLIVAITTVNAFITFSKRSERP